MPHKPAPSPGPLILFILLIGSVLALLHVGKPKPHRPRPYTPHYCINGGAWAPCVFVPAERSI